MAVLRASALIVLGLALAPSSACRASASPEEVARATLFFPPVFKYVDELRWSFSDAERLRALQEYIRKGADTLFEVVIDADGKVRRMRIVRTPVDEIYHEFVLEYARGWEFSPDERRDSYRAFYYPVEYRFRAQFEWL